MLLIFSEKITARLIFITDWIFSSYKINYKLTDNFSEFLIFNGNKINYSNRKSEAYQILPHALLSETMVKHRHLNAGNWLGLPTLFAQNTGSIPFDIFSATFFLITRYEEYLPYAGDKYGRFLPENSILTQLNVLSIPIVDIWLNVWLDSLKDTFPAFEYVKPKFELLTTIDIDNAFAYAHKSCFKTIASLAKKLWKRQIDELKKQLLVLTKQQPDPYDSYRFLIDALSLSSRKTIIFLLMRSIGRYDRNLSHKNTCFQKLIQELSTSFNLGIHPSFASNRFANLVAKEKKRLEQITQKKVVHSRQHFLILKFPSTYQTLLKAGITNDYSMGYASQIGFRAGTSRPFLFFNLLENKKTSLRIFPFQLMDVTLRQYMALSPEVAKYKIDELAQNIRNTGGIFSAVFHNESLGTDPKWKGWKQVFIHFLEKA